MKLQLEALNHDIRDPFETFALQFVQQFNIKFTRVYHDLVRFSNILQVNFNMTFWSIKLLLKRMFH